MTSTILASGSGIELACGAAAIALAIIGLAGGWPLRMAEIATIVVGAGVFAHGAAVAARWRQTVHVIGGSGDSGLVGGGVGIEVCGGAATVALGILALAGVLPAGMTAAAAIVIGGSILLGAAIQPQLAVTQTDPDAHVRRLMRGALELSAGAMVLLGIAGAILGILGIIDVAPALSMALVAMLLVGAALLLAGGAGALKFGRELVVRA